MSLFIVAITSSWAEQRPPGRVVLFSEPGFRGNYLEIEPEVHLRDLARIRFHDRLASFQDRIASVLIEGDAEIILYEHENYRGRSVRIINNVFDLSHIEMGIPTRYRETEEVDPFAAFLGVVFAPQSDEGAEAQSGPAQSDSAQNHGPYRGASASGGQSGGIRIGSVAQDYRDRSSSYRNWKNEASSLKVLPTRPHRGDVSKQIEEASEDERTGVCLFQHTEFRGRRWHFRGEYRLHNMSEIPDLNDAVSSIGIEGNYTIELFEHNGFRGRSISFTTDVENLKYVPLRGGGDWNDRFSSMIIRLNE